MKGKEEIPMNVITDAEINNVSFIARNTYNPAWMNHSYTPNFPRPPYPSKSRTSNYFNNWASNSNRQTIEDALETFITAQIEQNNNTMQQPLTSMDKYYYVALRLETMKPTSLIASAKTLVKK